MRMAERRSVRVVITLVPQFRLSLRSGCAGFPLGGSNTPSSAVHSPATACIRAGGTLEFTAKVSEIMDQSVVWSVNGTVSGNATVGKINTGGLYSAPAVLPTTRNSVTIEVSSA
jgi:hypothetical protein